MNSLRWTKSLALTHLLLIGGVIVSILPLLWMATGSVKQVSDIFSYPPKLIPSPATLESYRRLFAEVPFTRWFVNSVVTSLVATVCAVFFCALAGYAFAKFDFRGKRFLFDVMFSSLMVPFAVILVPLFILVTRLGWADSYTALIVPWVAPAFGIFLMRQFISGLPDELIQAARIDGCSEFRLFRSIMLPLARPALGTVGILIFIASWNSFIWPLVMMRSEDMFTLPVGIAGLNSEQSPEYGKIMAAAVLSSLPIVTVFFLMQRQIIAGLTQGAVKA